LLQVLQAVELVRFEGLEDARDDEISIGAHCLRFRRLLLLALSLLDSSVDRIVTTMIVFARMGLNFCSACSSVLICRVGWLALRSAALPCD